MSVSRVTQRSMSDATLRGLQANLSRVQTLQEQLSSGKRLAQPSDDPQATASTMMLRSRQAADTQYLRNVDQVSARMNVTDQTLQSLSDELRNARNLLVQSGNGALGTDARQALSVQLTQIRQQVIGLYNTQYLGRPLFGGTVQGGYAVDSSTGAYLGNDAPVTSRISSQSVVRVDVPGTSVGADTVPALLAQLATDVTNPTGASESDVNALDAATSQVLQALGTVGAVSAQVESTKTALAAENQDLTARISQNEDIDLPQAIMNLQAQQVGYQAALGAASKILQTSLVDFLR